MIRTAMPRIRVSLVRPALGAAAGLAILTGAALVAGPALAAQAQQKAAKAPKLSLSKPFQAAAAPLSKSIEDAKKRADVVAATNSANAAQSAAQAATGAASCRSPGRRSAGGACAHDATGRAGRARAVICGRLGGYLSKRMAKSIY